MAWRLDIRSPRALLLCGAVITAVLAAVPLVDVATGDSIAAHVRRAYPDWAPGVVSTERTAIAGYLVGIAALGVLGWLVSWWMLRRGSRNGRRVTYILFGVGALVALTNLSIGGEHYDRIIPTGYGVAFMIPVLVGLLACVRLWQDRPAAVAA